MAGGEGTGLITRAREIILHPSQTWLVIASEETSVRSILVRYVLILCALNPICFTLGRLVFGEKALGVVYRPPLLAALVEGAVSYVVTAAAVYVLALLIEGLATPFGGVRDRLSAFKLAAYSGTAGWVASLAYLYPPIGPLALAGVVYSLRLLYSGAEVLIRIDGRRTLGYVSLVVACYIVLMMLAIALAKLAAAVLS